jgi:hypothetical protein
MIQKPIGAPKDELQITLKIHHQLNINHNTIFFRCIKCSLVNMFFLTKDESNILILAFWHGISSLIIFNSKIW